MKHYLNQAQFLKGRKCYINASNLIIRECFWLIKLNNKLIVSAWNKAAQIQLIFKSIASISCKVSLVQGITIGENRLSRVLQTYWKASSSESVILRFAWNRNGRIVAQSRRTVKSDVADFEVCIVQATVSVGGVVINEHGSEWRETSMTCCEYNKKEGEFHHHLWKGEELKLRQSE